MLLSFLSSCFPLSSSAPCSMVKRSNKPHRKQTASELRRKKKLQHTNFQSTGSFVHPAIKRAWDNRKTLKQNYRALGLVGDVNDKRQASEQAERLPHIDIDEDADVLVKEMSRKRRREDSNDTADTASDDQREAEGDEQSPQGDEAEESGVVEVDESVLYEEAVDGVNKYELRRKKKAVAVALLHKELVDVQRLADSAPTYQVKSMPLDEQRRLRLLISKHGEDVHAMARDIKVNIHQQTEAELKRRIALLHKLQLVE